MLRLFLSVARWLGRRRERQIARLARTNPQRAELERLREDVRRAETENRLLRARLRRAESDEERE